MNTRVLCIQPTPRCLPWHCALHCVMQEICAAPSLNAALTSVVTRVRDMFNQMGQQRLSFNVALTSPLKAHVAVLFTDSSQPSGKVPVYFCFG